MLLFLATAYLLITSPHSITMNGKYSLKEVDAIRALYGPNAFVFRSNGKDYVVTDPAVIDDVKAIFRPQSLLGEEQSELGEKQSDLGELQSQLGEEQSRLGARQANASAKEQAELSRRQEQLSRRQEELSARQEVLSRQQNVLSERQNELSKKAEKKIAIFIEDLLKRGVAKPLK